MSTISGTITVEFDTNKTITAEQFEEFKRKVELAVENTWEAHISQLADISGFQSESIHSILLDSLECDYDDQENDYGELL